MSGIGDESGERVFRVLLMSAVAGMMLSSTAMGESAKLKAAWKLHQKECARCAGDRGKGDGKTSSMLKVKLADRSDSARMETLAD